MNRALVLTSVGLVLLMSCGGQPADQPAGSPCDQSVTHAGQAMQETVETVAAEAVAATEAPVEPQATAPEGEPLELPGMLRSLAESQGLDDTIAKVDLAVADAVDACGGKAPAYARISEDLDERAAAFSGQQPLPDSPAASEVSSRVARHWAGMILSFTSQEFEQAAGSTRAETPGGSPTSP